MKPVSLLLGGMAVSALAVAVPDLQQSTPQELQSATVETAQHTAAQNHDFTPPAPRGDLRADIASNAQGHLSEASENGSRQR